MKSTISVRVASIDELPGLAKLFNKYRISKNQPDDIDLMRRFVTERLRNHESVIFLAEKENKSIMGFAQLYPVFSSVSAKAAWLLNDLFVEEKYRGMGVGSALLEAVLRFRKNTNAAWITLQSAPCDKAAQALCKKFGFAQEKYLTLTNYSTEESHA